MSGGGATWLRPRSHPLVFSIFAGLAVVIFSCSGSIWLFGEVMCDQESGFSYPNPSPGARYVARVESADCGALGDLETKVVIRTYSFTGLPFTYDSQIVFESNINPRLLDLKWASPTRLVIEYPPGEPPYVRKSVLTWRGITIIHQSRSE